MGSNPSGLIGWLLDPGFVGWVGIAVPIFLALWGLNSRNKERLKAEKAKKELQLSELERLSNNIKRAHEHLSRLIRDPDDPGALAKHWRNDRNSVKLKLAQIQTDLDQLKSIPTLNVPAGQAGIASIQDVISALNIAKHALELESEPISQDAMERISDAISDSAKAQAGMALLRSLAVRRALKASLDVGDKDR